MFTSDAARPMSSKPFCQKYINVIAVKDGEDIRVTVNPKTLLRAEEVLILIGENKELAKLMKNRK